jgi:TPR repeat protein/CheY-like chemotaxis protein
MNTVEPLCLLVDPSPTETAQTQAVLHELGFRLEIVSHGEQCLSRLLEEPEVTVVLAAMQLGDMTGLELLQRVRGNNAMLALPFILMGGNIAPEVSSQAEVLGCGHVLSCPPPEALLSKAMASALPESHPALKQPQGVLEALGLEVKDYVELLRDFLGTVQMARLTLEKNPSTSITGVLMPLRDGMALLATQGWREHVYKMTASISGLKQALEHFEKAISVRIAIVENPNNKFKLQAALTGQDPDKCVRQFLPSRSDLIRKLQGEAEAGRVESEFELGHLLLRSSDDKEQVERGRVWLEKAASHRHPLAMCRLALLLLADPQRESVQGEGVMKLAEKLRCREAVWWSQALQEKSAEATLPLKADEGDMEAQMAMGRLYEKDDKFPSDLVEATYWLNRAAYQGHVGAQYRLALLYHSNRLGSDCSHFVVFWLKQAAEQNHADAQVMLARMYEQGEGVKPNPAIARGLYEKAAMQAHVHAMFCLGQNIENNMPEMVEGSAELRKALSWYLTGARFGSSPAQTRANDLQAKFSDHDRAMAQQEAIRLEGRIRALNAPASGEGEIPVPDQAESLA